MVAVPVLTSTRMGKLQPDAPKHYDPFCGLSQADAQARLKAEGYNELPRPDQRTPLAIIIEVIREPMLLLLLGAGAVYLIFGNLGEALVLLAFAMTSVLITVIQESRTERVLEALRDLTSPRALVIRDGERVRVAGRDVVRGDFVVLNEGDRVPADAVLIQSSDLQTDESLLTGESVPVRKFASANIAAAKSGRPGGDDLPLVFSGSLIVRGTGIGEVTATGVRSEIGKIGQSLNALETEPPRLQAQVRQLVRVFVMVGAPVCATRAPWVSSKVASAGKPRSPASASTLAMRSTAPSLLKGRAASGSPAACRPSTMACGKRQRRASSAVTSAWLQRSSAISWSIRLSGSVARDSASTIPSGSVISISSSPVRSSMPAR